MTTATIAPLHGPHFSSYDAAEVSWLLTDLSDVVLEASTEDREEAIQSGLAHYAESLPVEYQPTDAYIGLFYAALSEQADRVAYAVGLLTEMILADRPAPVLVSLARAGTPIGILMRRWASYAHASAPTHYAISIVRGIGVDREALAHIAGRHDPHDVVFVDGWTGKGAICRELRQALDNDRRFDPTIAVLADPGSCTTMFGTRDDFLIPSACLNSTVSGLVSRTVVNDRFTPPGRFHGAKFYRDLRSVDVSRLFLDRITERFPAVADRVARDWPTHAAADRTPTWSGWRWAVELCRRYGVTDVNLLKPGVGETTRVLLRRVPWQVLVRPGAKIDHVHRLAAERGVPIVEVPGLPFSCVGLIRPRARRTAAG